MSYESPSVDKLRVMTRHQLELYAWENAVQRIKFEQIAASNAAQRDEKHDTAEHDTAELDKAKTAVCEQAAVIEAREERIRQLERELSAAQQLLEQQPQAQKSAEPARASDEYGGKHQAVRPDEAASRRGRG